MTLSIKTFVVSHFEQNARLIFDHAHKKIIVIDPGANVNALFDACQLPHYSVQFILLTHCHIDHAGGVKKFLALFKQHQLPLPKLLYHRHEQVIGEHIEDYGKLYGFTTLDYENVPLADDYLDAEQEILCGDISLRCLFTPGHSPGHLSFCLSSASVCFEGAFIPKKPFSAVLIAGDTLFKGSIGRTDLPFANHDQLISSIRNQLFSLADDTLVCSGHGQNTFIGEEKQTNPFLQA